MATLPPLGGLDSILGIRRRTCEQAEPRREEGGADAVEVHILDVFVGIVDPFAAVHIGHILREPCWSGADGTDAAEALRTADQLIFHAPMHDANGHLEELTHGWR